MAVEDRNASYLSIVVILGWFIIQWQLSVLMQSFFQHRYGAHRQFTMSKRWERFFHLLAWVIQGPSYLHPPTYAIMHRMHHAYSDTPSDPHSPAQEKNFFAMMWRTRTLFDDLRYGRIAVEPRFEGGCPEWPFLDDRLRLGDAPRMGRPLYDCLHGAGHALVALPASSHSLRSRTHARRDRELPRAQGRLPEFR